MEKDFSPKIADFLQSKALFYCAILIFVLKIGISLAPVNFPKNIFFADITKAALEAMVNQARQARGLEALADSRILDQAAMMKAENMVQNQYFSHTGPDGTSPWHWFSTAKYNYKYAGENLAVGFYESREVYEAWLNSPSHKDNLLNPNYKEIGTAILGGFGPNNAIIVVQLFGSQKQALRPVAAIAEKEEKPQSSPNIHKEETIMAQKEPAVLGQESYTYNNFVADINYGIGAVMIGILILLIYFNSKFGLNKQLILRSGAILLVLATAVLINPFKSVI